jgi:hypothetical protein
MLSLRSPCRPRAPLRRPLLTLLLALPVLGGASCPKKPAGCEYDSTERCLWEEAAEQPEHPAGEQGEGGEFIDDNGVGPIATDTLDTTLNSMIDIMHAGLEWSLVDARARELCRTRDEEGELVASKVEYVDDSQERWSCPVADLELDDQEVRLEASSEVISLSAVDLDALQSETLLDFARTRFDEWCAGDFEEIESPKLEVFYRCPLPEGPYLVVARFPRDLDAGRWQVSIAVVDAG